MPCRGSEREYQTINLGQECSFFGKFCVINHLIFLYKLFRPSVAIIIQVMSPKVHASGMCGGLLVNVLPVTDYVDVTVKGSRGSWTGPALFAFISSASHVVETLKVCCFRYALWPDFVATLYGRTSAERLWGWPAHSCSVLYLDDETSTEPNFRLAW